MEYKGTKARQAIDIIVPSEKEYNSYRATECRNSLEVKLAIVLIYE